MTAERIEGIRAELPELPWQRRARLARSTACRPPTPRCSPPRASWPTTTRPPSPAAGNPKGIANWVHGRGAARRQGAQGGARRAPSPPSGSPPWSATGGRREDLEQRRQGGLRGGGATGDDPAAAVERLGLAQVSRHLADRGLDRRGDRAERRPRWPSTAPARRRPWASWSGQVMKRSGGRAEPKVVQQLMRQALDRSRWSASRSRLAIGSAPLIQFFHVSKRYPGRPVRPRRRHVRHPARPVRLPDRRERRRQDDAAAADLPRGGPLVRADPGQRPQRLVDPAAARSPTCGGRSASSSRTSG